MIFVMRLVVIVLLLTFSTDSLSAPLSDQIDIHELLSLTQKVRDSAPIATNSGIKELSPQDLDDLSRGAICSDYAHLLQQELTLRGVFSEAIAVSLDAIAAAGNSNFSQVHNHVFLAVGPYVADPTLGVVYKHSFAEMLADPNLSEDYLGKSPNERLDQILGRRLFAIINKVTYDGAVFRPSQQKNATLTQRIGATKHGDLQLLQDMDVTTRGKFFPHKGTLSFEYRFDKPVMANAFTVIPGWRKLPSFKQVRLETYDKGQKKSDEVFLANEYRRAGYLFLLPYKEPRDRFVVTFTGCPDEFIYLRELSITGRPVTFETPDGN